MHKWPLKRQADFAAVNAILVSFRLGLESRMEIGIDLLGREHADGGRQQAVDGAAQVVRGDGVLETERRHLIERVHAGVGAARPGHVHRGAFDCGENFFERALNGREPGLHLPAVKRRAVVGQMEADAAHQFGREPGFTTGMPRRHRGHSPGSCAATCKVANAARGTPTSARPPLRSMIDAAATTFTPAARSNSMTSCVLPPVVITSSTTTAVSPLPTVKPRRSTILEVVASRSVKRNRAPSAR